MTINELIEKLERARDIMETGDAELEFLVDGMPIDIEYRNNRAHINFTPLGEIVMIDFWTTKQEEEDLDWKGLEDLADDGEILDAGFINKWGRA